MRRTCRKLDPVLIRMTSTRTTSAWYGEYPQLHNLHTFARLSGLPQWIIHWETDHTWWMLKSTLRNRYWNPVKKKQNKIGPPIKQGWGRSRPGATYSAKRALASGPKFGKRHKFSFSFSWCVVHNAKDFETCSMFDIKSYDAKLYTRIWLQE